MSKYMLVIDKGEDLWTPTRDFKCRLFEDLKQVDLYIEGAVEWEETLSPDIPPSIRVGRSASGSVVRVWKVDDSTSSWQKFFDAGVFVSIFICALVTAIYPFVYSKLEFAIPISVSGIFLFFVLLCWRMKNGGLRHFFS